MNLRPNRRPAPDINLAPLIDVVFLLLIFFMVSTTFKDDARLRLNLPEAGGEPGKVEETERLEITIDRTGRTFVDDAAVVDTGAATLRTAMAGVLGTRRDLPVLIKADAATPHQAVMRALDAASALGLRQVAFAASRVDTSGNATPGSPAP